MEVSDFRNDIILAEACRQDVDKYCAKVEPGKQYDGSAQGSDGRCRALMQGRRALTKGAGL